MGETPLSAEKPPRKPGVVVTALEMEKSASSAGNRETPSIFNRKKKEEECAEEKRSNPFDEEQLRIAWQKFKTVKRRAEDMEKFATIEKVEKSEGTNVKLFLNRRLESSFSEKAETTILRFLRTELDNDFIELEKEVASVVETKKHYTSDDIYAYMVKQNSKLKELKEKLGLDFDY